MKKPIINFILASLASMAFTALSAYSQTTSLKLWYNQPAKDVWEAALPIGNGRLAAMVFGNTEKEKIQLNESSVWSGGPNRNDNPDALAALPEIRKLIFEGKFQEASKMAAENIQSKKNHGMKYQPVGDLELFFPGHDSANVTNYYRELDIEKAVTRVSYTVKGVTYTREVFASFSDDVIIIHIFADKPSNLTFTLGASSLHKNSNVAVRPGNMLVIAGKTSDHEGVKSSINFTSLIKAIPVGGKITSDGQRISIEKAHAVTIYVSSATNFVSYKDVSGDENKLAEAFLKKALKI